MGPRRTDEDGGGAATPYVEALDSPSCTLARAGGKGAGLSALVRAGLPVPEGFVVATAAYRDFVEANALGAWVMEAAASAASDAAALEPASAAIRDRFLAGRVPDAIAAAVRQAYAAAGRPPVAVRSSATAEDLPDLSFAGQQDTFLNVVGEDALLAAVVRCWSSLWTARAIAYRSRHGVEHRELALAVVVQRMVESEASGVLFTANPLSGRRTEMVVEATLGLGEALVAGRVEPDRYVAAVASGRILSRTLGSKRLAVRPQAGGGTVQTDQDAAGQAAITDDEVRELVRLGERAAEVLRGPQDVEWAVAEGTIWMLQSRPITSIYPLPAGVPAEPLQVFFSIGAVQGMLEPFTPLGQDLFRLGLPAAMARRLGWRMEPGATGPLVVAGERLFANVTPSLRHPLLRQRLAAGLALVEPGTRELLDRLFQDPRLAPAASAPRFSSLWPVARVGIRVGLPLVLNVLLNLLRPAARRAALLGRTDAAVAALEGRRTAARTPAEQLAVLDRGLETLPRVVVPGLASGIVAGIGMLRVLHRLAAPVPGGEQLVLEATRGLPHNVTTEMDLALWQVARTGSGRALDDFLARYGMRGAGEIDIGRPRWREDPRPVLEATRGYRDLPPELAPDAVFARGAAAAEVALRRLAAELRARPGGWWRAPLARWVGGRMRALAGLREAPKFFLVRVLGVAREALLAVGGPGAFFLHWDELRTLAAGGPHDFIGAVEERRAAYAREQRRRRVPRLLLSDGEALYGGDASLAEGGDEAVLAGSGVSPGVAEGPARIVFDPAAAQLSPGEVLVCQGTDPAWTPLFLTAGALVMEVGGLLTHGSVVAREYGIPAVVGVHQATARLRTGQRIRVDGSTGRVTVLS